MSARARSTRRALRRVTSPTLVLDREDIEADELRRIKDMIDERAAGDAGGSRP